MAFSRPSLGDLVTRISSDFSSRLTGGSTPLRRAFTYVYSRVYAGAVYLLYGYLDWIYAQAFPDTAESAQLSRWARIWGITRKPATFENIPVSFSATLNGVTIAQGTQLQRPDGAIFTVDSAVVTASGAAAITATNQNSGASSTLAGSTLTLLSPIAGVSSTVTVTGTSGQIAGTPGQAAEADASLLARLLNRIQLPPMGGAQNDYEQWSLDVAGVTRAWCFPNYYGNGTVGLTFVMDNNTPIIPGSSMLTTVTNFISDPSRKPVTAQLTVFALVADTLNFSIQGVSDPNLQAQIQAELQDLLKRETSPGGYTKGTFTGGTLYLSHINQAIQQVVGDGNHVLISPSADVVSSAGHIPVMGTITWS